LDELSDNGQAKTLILPVMMGSFAVRVLEGRAFDVRVAALLGQGD
jgi:hypothetical protein